MSKDTAELIHIKNAFGIVTDRRIMYSTRKDGLAAVQKKLCCYSASLPRALRFSGHYLLGFPTLLKGLGLLAGHGVLPVTGGVAMLFAVLLLWGSPTVLVNAAGQGLNQ